MNRNGKVVMPAMPSYQYMYRATTGVAQRILGPGRTVAVTLNPIPQMGIDLRYYLAYFEHSYAEICSSSKYMIIPWVYYWTRSLRNREFPCRCGEPGHSFLVGTSACDWN
jgi:hypothetical protein